MESDHVTWVQQQFMLYRCHHYKRLLPCDRVVVDDNEYDEDDNNHKHDDNINDAGSVTQK